MSFLGFGNWPLGHDWDLGALGFGFFLVAALLSMAVTVRADQGKFNLATYATVTTSYVSPHETIAGINADFDPENSNDKSRGAYGNWPRSGTQWVQFTWPQPISTSSIDVYWFDDHNGVRLPKDARLSYWDGKQFVPTEPALVGLKEDHFNTVNFTEVSTSRLRLELDSNGVSSTGILQWKVYDSGKSPHFAPVVKAGIERSVVLPGATYLSGFVKGSASPGKSLVVSWTKDSGPGSVVFANANSATTSATFSTPGDYVLKFTANDGVGDSSDTVKVTACPPPPSQCLQSVRTSSWKLNSKLWGEREKRLITNWVPHCVAMIDDPKLPQGGIDNFVQAASKLAGRPFTQNIGPVYCNAWVHNTVESMCYALMLDPQGDPEITKAQENMRATLADWIPKILAAQEPDGYLDTYYTLHGLPHWSNKWDHEGYNAGYFIESAIAHFQMTDRQDPRMYNAARKLADCWYDHVGPSSNKVWYDGHEELEQALVRLARLVDEVDGPGAGKKYVMLAKRLLDNRGHDSEYDQSKQPVTHQYEAVGHAVRAVYCYSGMAAVATETGDADYLSAVRSLWDNIVDKKYYITGGVGSGETSEGFGKNYSLPNSTAYCESCSGCGELFFQHDMQLAYHDSRYASLYEQTLYNAILGDVDLAGNNFTYTNSLDSSQSRYPWHECPCCVGNIPRTLLQLPTWIYSKGSDGLYVNLFVGSAFTIKNVAGTDVQMIQNTDYPWKPNISITVNPTVAKGFPLHIRVPDSEVSTLYTATPKVSGLTSLAINGLPMTPVIENGYAVIDRTWASGDRIDLVLPMQVQRVKAVDQVRVDRGRVALRYGPLVYNIESVDQNVESVLDPNSPLTIEWKPDLLGRVVVIHGAFADGKPLLAIPNYARSNRGGRSLVWIKDQ
jgi:DUF1680 family protein